MIIWHHIGHLVKFKSWIIANKPLTELSHFCHLQQDQHVWNPQHCHVTSDLSFAEAPLDITATGCGVVYWLLQTSTEG